MSFPAERFGQYLRMKYLVSLTDPVYDPAAPVSRLGAWFLQFIQDKRDLPFVYLILEISATLLPLAGLLFVPGLPAAAWWAVFGLYLLLTTFYFKGPFGLMLHCTSHRILFKKKYARLNHYIPWVIGPLFGQTPETYFTHHLGMHHPENNLPDDESSTMYYQRDSAASFGRYLVDFFLLGIPKLVLYFGRTNKPKLRFRLLRGEVVYLLTVAGLAFVNLPATLAVLVLPVLVTRAVMMLGNWSQHAFIDSADPGNCYTNSVTCINTKYNHKCWNDGYHISHHLKPALHWTEHPAHFRQNLAEYTRQQAVVFDGIHFLHIFAYLMTRRYDLLARHFVDLGEQYQSEAEVVTFLKSRTRRIPRLAPPVAVAA
ncbi:fatty acid desaturase family protein [Hymenobacter chitinivorans]|uniref:Fatty acid desaturase n=1 Tax=Hymenobacter chitinivorans DSM 11115 TaxID=1121954 RepID=A0A2M9BAL2_9BACT|nr:fatty acid desaturase [Hymenobacter chitinivorans]PJJ54990.1 fatty acid desaturase [Hymenobacter chitinivorans DSM 11115]